MDEDATHQRRFRSRMLLALGVLTGVRLVVAAWAPLSPDEGYYWVWSRALAPGYLDHPPMVALWIWLGTALAGDSALGVRLLGPFSAAMGSVLLADAGRALFPGRGAGVRAAVLLNATLMLGVGAVTMTPDTPLLFFWTAALWALARVAAGGSPRWWLVVGLAAGLGLDSKYTAALIGVGAGAWLLTPGMRPTLRMVWPWLGSAVAGVLFVPVVWWNWAHGWVSFVKQGGRAGDWMPVQAARYLAELFGGQVGLATPLLFGVFVVGVARAMRGWRDRRFGLLAAMVVPGAAVFVQHALGDRVQANWVAVLYPGAALAAGGLAVRWWRPAAVLGLVLTAAVYGQAVALLALPRGVDPTERISAWGALAQDAGAVARAEGAAFLASEEYGVASLLAWHAPGVAVVAAGPRWRLFDLPAAPASPGLLVLSTRRREGPDPHLWQSAQAVGTLSRRRGGVEIEGYSLYRVVPVQESAGVILPEPNRSRDAVADRR